MLTNWNTILNQQPQNLGMKADTFYEANSVHTHANISHRVAHFKTHLHAEERMHENLFHIKAERLQWNGAEEFKLSGGTLESAMQDQDRANHLQTTETEKSAVWYQDAVTFSCLLFFIWFKTS